LVGKRVRLKIYQNNQFLLFVDVSVSPEEADTSSSSSWQDENFNLTCQESVRKKKAEQQHPSVKAVEEQ